MKETAGAVKEEEVNVEKPRRNPRRRCIDSGVQPGELDYHSTSRSVLSARLSRVQRARTHTTQRFYTTFSTSTFSPTSLPRTCVHASAPRECERTYGRSSRSTLLADVFKKCGEWTSRLTASLQRVAARFSLSHARTRTTLPKSRLRS